MKQISKIPVDDTSCQGAGGSSESATSGVAPEVAVALLTGGGDRPYVFGLTTELLSKGAAVDLIGSDQLDGPEFKNKAGLNFFNLRGDQRPDADFLSKVLRVARYYFKLFRYAATAKPKIFHILWNNKIESLDRTLLMLYYKALGKRIVLTAHNVNQAKRDCNDTPLNRLTLRIQYRLADHLFVHTEKMKLELIEEFGVRRTRITVIPFGINNAAPNTSLTSRDARRRLGIRDGEKTILFFGTITPYKGLEYLIEAFKQIHADTADYRLIVAGRLKDCEDYWGPIREAMQNGVESGRILVNASFISDEQTEVYFKAADVLVLPYRHVYQSGVMFLGYSFGLPVLAADVGSLKEEVIEGRTGYMFRSEDPAELASAIKRYFSSDLFADLDSRRQDIRDIAAKRHSWDVVGEATMNIYARLLQLPSPREASKNEASNASLDVKASS
jgi:D-inositol-3-phosphate glycosyltransferase